MCVLSNLLKMSRVQPEAFHSGNTGTTHTHKIGAVSMEDAGVD